MQAQSGDNARPIIHAVPPPDRSELAGEVWEPASRQADEQVEAETWSRTLTPGDFDWGCPVPGVWSRLGADGSKRRQWDKTVAVPVRRYGSG
jgi:hypothetical protein